VWFKFRISAGNRHTSSSFVALLNSYELRFSKAADPEYFNFRNLKLLALIREKRRRNVTPHNLLDRRQHFGKPAAAMYRANIHSNIRSYCDSSVGVLTRVQRENCGSITRRCYWVRLFPKPPYRVWSTGSILFSGYPGKEDNAWSWPVNSIYWRMCGAITSLPLCL
jgi:hypothetical protein